MYAQIQPQQYPTDGIKTNMSSQFKKKKVTEQKWKEYNISERGK